MPRTTLLDPSDDHAHIATALSQGSRLVAWLCAEWCATCDGWNETLAQWREAGVGGASPNPDDCWVWVDIEERPDLVAGFQLEDLPVLLIQTDQRITHLDSARSMALARNTAAQHALGDLLASTTAPCLVDVIDPGLREYLLYPDDARVAWE